MVGLDSLWRPDYEDAVLRRIAREEGRVLLTRDRELNALAAKEATSHWVNATEPNAQFREVITQFELLDRTKQGIGFLTLCLECNSPILPAKAGHLTERVPAHVLEEHEDFFLCPRCERVYWQGTHFERMRQWVQDVLK